MRERGANGADEGRRARARVAAIRHNPNFFIVKCLWEKEKVIKEGSKSSKFSSKSDENEDGRESKPSATKTVIEDTDSFTVIP